MLEHKLGKLKKLKELQASKDWMLLSKHNLLFELWARQSDRTAEALDRSQQLKLLSLRIVHKFMPTAPQIIGVLLLLSVLTSTSFIAQASVPGQVLWPVKITLERAEVALALNTSQQGRVHIKHIRKRLLELDKLKSQPTSAQLTRATSQVVLLLENDIRAANQSLKVLNEEKRISEPNVVLKIATDLKAGTTEASKALVDQQNNVNLTLATLNTNSIASTTATVAGNDSIVASTTADSLKTAASGNNLSHVIEGAQNVNTIAAYSALTTAVKLLDSFAGQSNASIRQEISALLNEEIQNLEVKQTQLEQQHIALSLDIEWKQRDLVRALLASSVQKLNEGRILFEGNNMNQASNKIGRVVELHANVRGLLDDLQAERKEAEQALLDNHEIIIQEQSGVDITIQTIEMSNPIEKAIEEISNKEAIELLQK